MAWFDRKDMAPGVLTNIISEDISLLNGLTTETISIFLEAIFSMTIGIVFAFSYTWRMSLITGALAPFLIVGGALRARLISKESRHVGEKKEDDKYAESNALLSDIVINYKTVIGFGPSNITYLLKKYSTFLE